MTYRRTIPVVFLLALTLAACEPSTDKESTDGESGEVIRPDPIVDTAIDPDLEAATLAFWQHGGEILTRSQDRAGELRDAVARFLAAPDSDTRGATQLAWQRAHQSYQDFQLYLALADSNPGLFGELASLDYPIDAHPIQPGFLDYFDVYTQSGIVNDTALPLTADALRQQHGLTDAGDVALGFHALEYLLWGEQGQRPVTDFAEATELSEEQQAAELRLVDLPTNRRRIFLQLVSDLLLDDLQILLDQWNNKDSALHQQYLALNPNSQLELARNAAILWLEQTLSALEPADGNIGHNPFAGGNVADLAHSLAVVENEFLAGEDSLATRVLTDEQRTQLAEPVAQLREQLRSWHDQPWPPASEERQQMIETLLAFHGALGLPAAGDEPSQQ